MIAYENNRPITRGSTTTQMRAYRDDAIAFIEIVIWGNGLTRPDKRDEAIEMINKMHGFVRSKGLKELIIYITLAIYGFLYTRGFRHSKLQTQSGTNENKKPSHKKGEISKGYSLLNNLSFC